MRHIILSIVLLVVLLASPSTADSKVWLPLILSPPAPLPPITVEDLDWSWSSCPFPGESDYLYCFHVAGSLVNHTNSSALVLTATIEFLDEKNQVVLVWQMFDPTPPILPGKRQSFFYSGTEQFLQPVSVTQVRVTHIEASWAEGQGCVTPLPRPPIRAAVVRDGGYCFFTGR